jgi:hypothetical protein
MKDLSMQFLILYEYFFDFIPKLVGNFEIVYFWIQNKTLISQATLVFAVTINLQTDLDENLGESTLQYPG